MRKIDAEALQKAMEFVTNDPTCPMHIAATIDQIIDCAPTVDDWIKCSEKLPEKSTHVLFALYGIHVRYGFRNDSTGSRNAWTSDGFQYDDNEVTHWRPLPEPPKEEEE